MNNRGLTILYRSCSFIHDNPMLYNTASIILYYKCVYVYHNLHTANCLAAYHCSATQYSCYYYQLYASLRYAAITIYCTCTYKQLHSSIGRGTAYNYDYNSYGICWIQCLYEYSYNLHAPCNKCVGYYVFDCPDKCHGECQWGQHRRDWKPKHNCHMSAYPLSAPHAFPLAYPIVLLVAYSICVCYTWVIVGIF